jgi:MFS family permease
MQFLGGAFADGVGRRPVLALGVIGSMTLYSSLAFMHSLWQIAIPIFIEAAVGWAMFLTASNAMVADLTSLELRAEAFSITRVALNAGTIIGPLIAGPLLVLDRSFRLPFVTAAGVCGIFLVMVLTLIKESKPGGRGRRRGAQAAAPPPAPGAVPAPALPARRALDDGIVTAEPGGPIPAPLDLTAGGPGPAAEPAAPAKPAATPAPAGYGVVLHDARFLLFCLAALLPLYCFGQIWVTYPVILRQLYGVSPRGWGLLLVVYALVGTVLQYPLVRAVRGRDAMVIMAASSALLGLGLGLGAFAPWSWCRYALMMVLSVGILLLVPIATTVVAGLAPAHLRGRYMGVWTLVYLAGYALGPLFGGFAMDALGDRAAYAVVIGFGLAGAAFFWLMRGTHAAPALDAAGSGA